MIVTVNLAKGALAMSRRKVIVKRLNSIQNFGAMNVLCTDKTGTLTQDRIILKRYLDIRGDDSDRVLEYAYLNSFHQSGLKNLLDVAVLSMSSSRPASRSRPDYQKIDEMPFDFERRRMSVVLGRDDGVHILICKGAVEEVFAACKHYAIDGETGPLDASHFASAHGDDGEAQRGRVSGRRGRLQGDAADADGVFGRRRGRPHLARLHRLSRSAEGDLRRRACHAEGQRRGR